MAQLRYLLLQIRNPDDAMRAQEVRCFAQMLECSPSDIEVHDLLLGVLPRTDLGKVDMVLLGGSGHYSAAGHGPWLEVALESMRELHRLSKPTFASCWGFQAMSRAMGGRCIHDPSYAELGTVDLHLTDDGRRDPLFSQLPTEFSGMAGHEDHVVELPPGAVLLASSARVPEQAFRFADKPIYCTQFHPELDRQSLLERARAYPEYIERIAGISFAEFAATCHETPEANTLLRRFVALVFR